MSEIARATQGQHDRAALLERLRGKKPITATYRMVLDPALKDRLVEAEKTLTVADLRASRDSDGQPIGLADVRQAVKDAQAAVDEATLDLHFTALPPDVLDALLLEHPPTDEDRARDPGVGQHMGTFGPALISAASLDGLTVDDVIEWRANGQWSSGEYTGVYVTAQSCQNRQSLA